MTSPAPSAQPSRAPHRVGGLRRSAVVVTLLAALVVAGCNDKAPPAGTDSNTASTVAGAASGADPAGAAQVVTTLFEPPTYTVTAGDTIGKIATKLGVPVQSLIDANGIAKPDKIQVGQKLRVPSGPAAATTTTAG